LQLPNDLQDSAEFEQKLVAVYGRAIAQRIVDVLHEESAVCYWKNPLLEARQLDADLPAGDTPLRELDEVFVSRAVDGISQSSVASRGLIYLQNPSSYFAARTLAPARDEEVLDLAAAPGSKTIAMAAMMDNTGRIAAVEPIKARFHRLRANLERCGVTNVQLYQRDGRGVGRAVGERFDRVLLDAPCSSEARIRWSDPTTYRHWTLRKIKEAARKQKSLLRSAYLALRPGGELLYSTCSFAPEENEMVVHHLLKKTDAQLLPIERQPANAITGLTQWRNKGSPELAKCVRIVPDGTWDGFFLARICKPNAN
jgi:NOL1/NOP2/sun family putative RNA methylase